MKPVLYRSSQYNAEFDAVAPFRESIEQPQPEIPADPEIGLIAGEAAEPGGCEQQRRVEQTLCRGKGGKKNEGFAFEKGPDKSDQIKAGAVLSDQPADVHSRPSSCFIQPPRAVAGARPQCTFGAGHAMVFRASGRANSRVTGKSLAETDALAGAAQRRRRPMAGLYFEEFEEGQVFEHAISRTVTEMDNVLFSTLTMNPQPLHLDEEFAKTDRVRPAPRQQPVHPRSGHRHQRRRNDARDHGRQFGDERCSVSEAGLPRRHAAGANDREVETAQPVAQGRRDRRVRASGDQPARRNRRDLPPCRPDEMPAHMKYQPTEG